MFSEYRGCSDKSLIAAPTGASLAKLLTLYPVADEHLGLLAWGAETGESWDVKIAKRAIMRCMSQLVSETPPSALAVLLDLGDGMHANDQRNVTPASGHQLDVDGRYPQVKRE